MEFCVFFKLVIYAIAIDNVTVPRKDKNGDDINQMVNDNDLDECFDEEKDTYNNNNNHNKENNKENDV